MLYQPENIAKLENCDQKARKKKKTHDCIRVFAAEQDRRSRAQPVRTMRVLGMCLFKYMHPATPRKLSV